VNVAKEVADDDGVLSVTNLLAKEASVLFQLDTPRPYPSFSAPSPLATITE